jgi:hypothetical protein
MITLWFKVMGTQFHTSQMLMMRISLEVFIKIEAGAFQLMPFLLHGTLYVSSVLLYSFLLMSIKCTCEVLFCAFMVAILLLQTDIPDHLSCYFTTWAKWDCFR